MPATRAIAGEPQTVPVAALLLGVNDDLSPAVERTLGSLATAAGAGDDAAREQLYAVLSAKLDRIAGRAARRAWESNTPRRDGVPWEIEDLRQEVFPTFVDLLGGWDGQRPFGAYLLAHFPWRLRHVQRALAHPRRFELVPMPPGAALLTDDSAEAEEARLLLEGVAASLPPIDGKLLLWHLRDGEPLGVVARRLRRDRRTVTRRWQALQQSLRSSFEDA